MPISTILTLMLLMIRNGGCQNKFVTLVKTNYTSDRWAKKSSFHFHNLCFEENQVIIFKYKTWSNKKIKTLQNR